MNAQATFLLPAESQAEGTGTSEPSALPFRISQYTKHNNAYFTTVFHKDMQSVCTDSKRQRKYKLLQAILKMVNYFHH